MLDSPTKDEHLHGNRNPEERFSRPHQNLFNNALTTQYLVPLKSISPPTRLDASFD